MAQDNTQFELSQPPTDGITNVQWCRHSPRLLVTSWDKSVTLYEINAPNSRKVTSYDHKAGVLGCAITDDDLQIFTGGCDSTLMMCDATTGTPRVLGTHEQPIRCVEYSTEGHVVVTGSWDQSVKVWDPRQPEPLVTSVPNLGGKVFSMSVAHMTYNLVAALSGRKVLVFDLRNLGDGPYQTRESSLKHQTRCVACHPLGESYILSSIEGRVAVEFFDAAVHEQRKYAFKCHRIVDKQHNTQTIFPVNTIAFHPLHKTFATGGCDGVVNIWDGENKKRIFQFPAYSTSVASLAFNNDGGLLAIAQSYTWEQGPVPTQAKDTVYIRHVREAEVKPKKKKQ